jgi:Fe-Mn family superoxide dismutase
MVQHVAPMPCKPWTLSGLSERLIVSHYEDDYGAAVRSLNAIRSAIEALDLEAAPAYQIRALKREEAAAAGSVALHEVYFGSLGGDGAVLFTGTGAGSKMPDAVSTALAQGFKNVKDWHRGFVALARALEGGPGWVLLNYSRRDGTVHNHLADDHARMMPDTVPLLALDMYEHAYRLDFGANASAYIDAFMRNIDWAGVASRLDGARGSAPDAPPARPDETLPSISAEELQAKMAAGGPLQVLDARPRHYFSRSIEMMRGAMWRDPNAVGEWSKDLRTDIPVVVYCAYGFAVGCGVTASLRERGFDAKFLKGGLSAWYAAGGLRALKVEGDCDNAGGRR